MGLMNQRPFRSPHHTISDDFIRCLWIFESRGVLRNTNTLITINWFYVTALNIKRACVDKKMFFLLNLR
ncbi:MAG: hypothetical protein ACI9AV_001181 [Sediminicola sp.]|jgi:hypothetical protein